MLHLDKNTCRFGVRVEVLLEIDIDVRDINMLHLCDGSKLMKKKSDVQTFLMYLDSTIPGTLKNVSRRARF